MGMDNLVDESALLTIREIAYPVISGRLILFYTPPNECCAMLAIWTEILGRFRRLETWLDVFNLHLAFGFLGKMV